MREEQDKKLADKGWQSMQQLLDRDMPTDRKRRPVAWWWLGLLLLPLAILGGRTWWQTESRQPAEQAPAMIKTERPVVLQNAEHQPAPPERTPVRSAEAKPAQANKSVASAGNQAPQLSVVHSQAKNPVHVMQPADQATTIPNPVTDIVSTPTEQVTAALPEAGQSVVVAETEPTPAATTDTQNDIETATALLETPLHAVEKEYTDPVTTKTFAAYIAENPVVKPVQTNPRWAFGLSASASTEYFKYLNTISGGLTADWRFARKLGLRTSILYTRYRPSPSRQPVVAVEEVRYSNATGLYTGAFNVPTGSNSNIHDTSEEDYVYIPLRKLHQIEMPVLAWWQPIRNLRVYSGISVEYTFFGQSADQNYIDNSLVLLDSYASQKNASIAATSALNRWQLQYQGGLGLRLGRHAELSAFWRSPLRNILPQQFDQVSFNSDTEQFHDPSLSVSSNSLPLISRFILQGTWLF